MGSFDDEYVLSKNDNLFKIGTKLVIIINFHTGEKGMFVSERLLFHVTAKLVCTLQLEIYEGCFACLLC